MALENFKRKLAAILSADVKGYSRLMGEDEEGTIHTLKVYMEVITGFIQQQRGRVVATGGDSVLVEFTSVVDAVRCAVGIQEELKDRNKGLPEERRMEFRIGINLGDVVEEGDNILGDGVNVAARIESLAEAGGICISGTAYDQVKNKLAFGYEYIGEQAVKNIKEPVRVYRVLMEPETKVSEIASKEKVAIPLPDKPSIAVLPFANMSGDPEQEYFSDGITEDVITALSKFRWFFVIARNSTFTYKRKAVDIKTVAQDLGVRYVLEGSVRKAGSRVRITAQLIDATTNHHVWAERYDRDVKDIFAVQDEITENIVTSIGPEFISAEMRRAQRRDVRNLDAWDYIMRAAFHHSHCEKEEVAEAQRLLLKAIELDPFYAEGFCLLALTHLTQVQFGWSESADQSINEAAKAAENAFKLDDRDAWTYTALGLVDLILRRYDNAIRRLKKAIDLNPSLANAYGALGQALALAGEYVEAVEQINKAIRLSPRDPFLVYWLGHLGLAAFAEEQYDVASQWGAKIVQENSSFPGGHRLLAASYGQLGQIKEAQAALMEVFHLMPGMTIDDVRKQVPFKNPDHMERYVDGLRKAGLK